VFPYSPRPGTPAADWPDTLPKAERTARAARLRTLAESRKRGFLKTLRALPELTVLVERAKNLGNGVCEFYAPCLVRPGLEARQPRAHRPEGVRTAGLSAPWPGGP
jgi:tRNA A37 methylthiotransferase MiaB